MLHLSQHLSQPHLCTLWMFWRLVGVHGVLSNEYESVAGLDSLSRSQLQSPMGQHIHGYVTCPPKKLQI